MQRQKALLVAGPASSRDRPSLETDQRLRHDRVVPDVGDLKTTQVQCRPGIERGLPREECDGLFGVALNGQ